MIQKIAVKIVAGAQESSGFVDAHIWSPEEKNGRGRRGLGLCVGLAFASIFLPVAHFFLVPGFLILSPIVYRWLKRQKGRVLRIDAKCPRCEAALSLAEGNMEWPVRFPCKKCFEPLRVTGSS